MANWYRDYKYDSYLEDYARKKADIIIRKRSRALNMNLNNSAKSRIYNRQLKKYYRKYGERKKKSLSKKWFEFMFPWMED